MKVRVASPDDAAAIAAIYAPYVTASVISFETEAPDAAEVARRMAEGGDLYPWFVACDPETDAVLGYAYACAFRSRPAYRFSVETTVYVADGTQRRGIPSKSRTPGPTPPTTHPCVGGRDPARNSAHPRVSRPSRRPVWSRPSRSRLTLESIQHRVIDFVGKCTRMTSSGAVTATALPRCADTRLRITRAFPSSSGWGGR